MVSNSRSDKAIAPNFRKAILPWRDECFRATKENLIEMFKSADQVLLEFADKAQNNKIQAHFFEAMRELWLKQDNVIANFQDGLERHIFRFREMQEANPIITETLSLVSKDSFEKNIALQTISDQAEKKAYTTLYTLSQRLAVVNEGRPVQIEDIPASPKQLAEIFEKCTDTIYIENQVRLVLYTLFDRFIISRTLPLYEDLNQRLIEAGVLPDLKFNIVNKQADIKEDHLAEKPADGMIVQELDSIDEIDSPGESSPELDSEYKSQATSAEIAEDSFEKIKDLLAIQRSKKMAARKNRRRSSDQQSGSSNIPAGAASGQASASGSSVSTGYSPGSANQGSGQSGSVAGHNADTGFSASPGGGGSGGGGTDSSNYPAGRPSPIASSSEVLSIIGDEKILQYEPLPETNVRQEAVKRVEVDAQLIVSINKTLKKQRELIKKLVGQDRIPAEDEDVIDIVGMIFELMLNEKQLSNEVKTLLSHLHTPYLKIAVEDPSFLTEHEHPARRLFELMITTGSEWVDSSDLTKGIYPQIQFTVNKILGNKGYNESLFNQLAMKLTEAHALLTDKHKITEDRTIEVEKGRAKLNQAKEIARKQTHRMLTGKLIIEDAHNFLYGPWIDYLTLVLLRSDFNEKSDSWQQALSLGTKLVQFSLSSQDPNGGMPSSQALHDLSNELKDIVGSLIPHYQIEMDTYLEALADKSKRESFVTPADPEADQKKPDIKVDEARLREEIVKLRNLQPGTWFGFSIKGSNSENKVKLSWYNPVTSNFLFVNQNGVKADVKNINQLAYQIISGEARVYEKSGLPFIDRSFRAIKALLEKTTK